VQDSLPSTVLWFCDLSASVGQEPSVADISTVLAAHDACQKKESVAGMQSPTLNSITDLLNHCRKEHLESLPLDWKKPELLVISMAAAAVESPRQRKAQLLLLGGQAAVSCSTIR